MNGSPKEFNQKTYLTADQASAKIGTLTAERLSELAKSGYAPCYYVDDQGPFFKISELREWVMKHLVVATGGMPLPTRLEVRIPSESRPISDAPESISKIDGLRHIDVSRGECPGVYFLCDEWAVVYVGQSRNVVARIWTHVNERQKVFDHALVFFLPVPESELLKVEAEFIKRLKPIYNRESGKSSQWRKEMRLASDPRARQLAEVDAQATAIFG